MKRIIAFAAVLMLTIGCENIDFDDPTTLTNREASEVIKDLAYKLSKSAVQNVFNQTTAGIGMSLPIYADQITSTSNANGRRYFSEEPRISLVNNASHRMHFTLDGLYSGFYQANLDATIAIDIIENQGKKIYDNSGTDRTQDCLVAAYFTKGVSQGYLGVIFDRGIIVDETTSSQRDFPDSYTKLVDNGITHLNKSIELASNHAELNFDFLQGIIIEKATFIQLANSLAARILSSLPRDKQEAAALGAPHWQKVLDYANKGLDKDYIIPTVSGGYFSGVLNGALTRNSGGVANADWVDIKIPYLADKTGTSANFHTYPNIPGQIVSDDQRFYEYFAFSKSLGSGQFPDRGPGIVSNYMRKRWYNPANTLDTPGALNPYFLAEEIRLLKAEAKLWLKDNAGAAAELNNASSARKSKGKLLTDIATDDASLIKALHYEYAIEIDLAGGIIVPFTFMRRHNLLIGGTPTELPVPQAQLELIKKEVYTFGGKENFGQKGIHSEIGTALNEGWKASQ